MPAPVTPVNVQVPAASTAPIVADFLEHALRVAYVNRRDLERMPTAGWSVPGIYVLLTDDGTRRAYVGQAVDLRKRLLQHRSVPKFKWSRAVVTKRDTTHGFNSAEIGYLEGRLAAEMRALDGIQVVEGKRDQDSTLPPHMQLSLDALMPSLVAALRLAGLDTNRVENDANAWDEFDDSPSHTAHHAHPVPRERSRRITYPATRITKAGTVADLVAQGFLQAGERLFARQGSRNATALVTTDGDLLVDQLSHRSPSGAACHALGLQSVNGWITWRVGSENGPTLDALRDRLTSTA